MTATAFDQVKELNKLSEDLLRSHSEPLERKNIRRRQQLVRAIKLDLDKLTHALLEVKENRAESLLRKLLGESAVNQDDVVARLAGQHIYHVGFEIHEPLSLVLYGINHWIQRSNQALGTGMFIRNYLRFPASPAFQKRVGAYAEIMRIWLQVNERVLMLELFDIHRPADSVLESAPKLTHRNFHGLFECHDVDDHDNRMTHLFKGDQIWHYALYVQRPSDVSDLHNELQSLTARSSKYFMPYAAPVYNQHDNSFHTKIVMDGGSPGDRLELEFVTDLVDSQPG
jgi:hypothetical protein